MKMTKSGLKALIKECLVEILSEGLGSEAVNEAVNKIKQPAAVKQPLFPRHQQVPTRNPALDQIIQREANINPMMKSILEDTANHSLPKMLANNVEDNTVSHDLPNSNRPQLVEHVKATPDEIFGADTVERWNSLAF